MVAKECKPNYMFLNFPWSLEGSKAGMQSIEISYFDPSLQRAKRHLIGVVLTSVGGREDGSLSFILA